MIDMIIWSKNRAMQLDLLLRSCVYNDFGSVIGNIFILYDCDDYFLNGYEKLKTTYIGFRKINFIKQNNFKKDILNILKNCGSEYVLGNSDDNVFIGMPKDEDIYLFEDQVAISLRLHPFINFCQPANLKINPPLKIFKDGRFGYFNYKWNQEGLDPRGCWGYPHPCDSNIYKTSYLYDLLVNGDFNNPASMENWMNRNRNDKVNVMVFRYSPCLINICNNRVQNTQNPCGNASASDLEYLRFCGKQIVYDHKDMPMQRSCHIIREYKYEDFSF